MLTAIFAAIAVFGCLTIVGMIVVVSCLSRLAKTIDEKFAGG